MTSTTTAEQPTARRRFGAFVAVVACLGAIGAAGTSAAFSDQEVITGNTFTSGAFDLTAEQSGLTLAVTGMVPGDSESIEVPVTNSGDVDLRYALAGGFTAAVTDAHPGAEVNLGDTLAITVKDSGGTVLYEGATGANTGERAGIFGDATTGEQEGDRVLAGGDSEELTVEVSFVDGPDVDTFAGAGAELTLHFDAEQTKNT